MLGYTTLSFIIHHNRYFRFCQFSDIHVSQGSVATYLMCGGIFKYAFVATLPLSLTAKEFWKTVIIWGSYGQEFFRLVFIDLRCGNHSVSLAIDGTLSSWRNPLISAASIRLVSYLLSVQLSHVDTGHTGVVSSSAATVKECTESTPQTGSRLRLVLSPDVGQS